MSLADRCRGPLGLGFLRDAEAIIGIAPGGSVARRHAIVATEAVVDHAAHHGQRERSRRGKRECAGRRGCRGQAAAASPRAGRSAGGRIDRHDLASGLRGD